MRSVALLLACVACMGHAQRPTTLLEQPLSGTSAESQKLVKKACMKELAKLLLTPNAGTAFMPCSAGARPRLSSLRPVVSGYCAGPRPQSFAASKAAPVMAANTQQSEELDGGAVARYVGAVALQMVALGGTLGAIDAVTDLALGGQPLPWQAVTAMFFLLSLRSRIFSPLDNSRPDLQKATDGEKTKGFNDRKMPSWTPPGVVFPIMWVLIVAPLRAYSSTLVWEAHGGHLLDPTLLCLLLHLSIGDTWNTINNVERRVGAAVPGVACVWLSVLFATAQYFQADELAGKLLAVTVAWITVAGTLVADTWRVNNEVEPEPLYPYKKDGLTTRFIFES